MHQAITKIILGICKNVINIVIDCLSKVCLSFLLQSRPEKEI